MVVALSRRRLRRKIFCYVASAGVAGPMARTLWPSSRSATCVRSWRRRNESTLLRRAAITSRVCCLEGWHLAKCHAACGRVALPGRVAATL